MQFRPMCPHIDDILTTEFAIIQFSGFDGEAVFFDASRRGEDMRMMIALIAIPVRRMDGNISNDAVSIHKIRGKAKGKVLAFLCCQI